MALITCPDCGRQLSELAPACLGCGRPLAASPPRAVSAQGAGAQDVRSWQEKERDREVLFGTSVGVYKRGSRRLGQLILVFFIVVPIGSCLVLSAMCGK